MPTATLLLAVPNVSEGRSAPDIAAIVEAFQSEGEARLIGLHSDPDHHRSVVTLAGEPGHLAQAILAGARETVARVNINAPRGAHPHVGALDVVPLVYLDEQNRGAACAEALKTADLIADELDVPVLLYGALAGDRTRATLRKGGLPALTQRLEAGGDLTPDFGPGRPHPTAGVTLVAARPPLVAFNVELEPPANLHTARKIATLIREGGPEGLPGLRAIGIELTSRGARAQVSMNVEDPIALPLHRIVQAVAAHAPVGEAEVVGLAPRAALEGFPAGVTIRDFDPARQVIEDALGL